MKTIPILLILLIVGFASRSQAQLVPASNGKWFMQLNGDLDSPTGNLANAVNQGWGGEAAIGYYFPHNFEISLETGFDTYSEKDIAFNGSWNLLPLVLKAQLHFFDDSDVQPYLLLAAGAAFNSRYATFGSFTGSNNEVDFLGEAGFGLSFILSPQSSFYVQAKMELDNTSSNYAADQPTVLISLNAGVKFALN
jgi:outer membrane protein W